MEEYECVFISQLGFILLLLLLILLQARVPGSSPGGDSQFFLQTFPVCLFPSNQLILILLGHTEEGLWFDSPDRPYIFQPDRNFFSAGRAVV